MKLTHLLAVASIATRGKKTTPSTSITQPILHSPNRQGTVLEPLPDANFKVMLENGKAVTASISQLMKPSRSILPGDIVTIELMQGSQKHGSIISQQPRFELIG